MVEYWYSPVLPLLGKVCGQQVGGSPWWICHGVWVVRMHTHLSSMPSQFSSMPLPQISAEGVRAVQFPQLPALQVWLPVPHIDEQPRLSPSSICPLQSSSRLLQTSAVGSRAVHAPHVAAEQVWVPAPHAEPQARERFSSTWPLQSSSSPLQVAVRIESRTLDGFARSGERRLEF